MKLRARLWTDCWLGKASRNGTKAVLWPACGRKRSKANQARDGGNGGSDQGLATAAAEARMAQATAAGAGGSGGSDDSGLRYGRENMK